MKKILITGATSFLGRSTLRRIEKNKSYSIVKTSLHGDKKNNIIALDLADEKKTREIFQKLQPDIVLHFAALVNLTRDFETAKKCIDSNIRATLNLLEATKNSNTKKIIFASTEEVYGDNRVPFKENQIPHPPSMYSISKVAGENLMEYYSKLHGFTFIALRFGTFYGPESQKNRFLTKIIQAALSNESILLNSGKLKRDYIFIDDAVDAVERAIKKSTTLNQIINIGGQDAVSLYEFVKRVVKHSQSKSKIILNAFPDRVGEAQYQKMDLTIAKRFLNWHPTTTLDDGIKKSIDFFSKKGYYKAHAK